jgi:hypothetical protein
MEEPASVRGGACLLLPPVPIFFRIFVLMKGVVVTAKSPSEFKFLMDLFKKLGLSSAPVSEEELEDLALSKMMKSVDRKKKVSREAVMQKLKA